ncbi:MAG: protein kinase [Chloroflexi bacterium]|nr:protein kinase [Chloroflexota bacterium]
MMSADLIGKTINGYEILSQVGQGGMATVYLARQRSMNRQVALKFLPSVFINDEAYLQRFEREVNIVSQLEHRNIVPVYDFGKYENQPYIAMRYMPAGSVEELLAQGRIPLPRVASIVEQVASALDYAHQKGILHRDLKPSNILLDDGGGVFITDFGIARILGEGSGAITTQGVVGTPSYMSPEQARAEPLDGRSDVYSLGVMLFELVTGRRPFESDTPYSIAIMHVTMPPPPPRQFEPDISPRLEKVIIRALRKAREERFGSAGELAEALRLSLDGSESLDDGAAPEAEAISASRPAEPVGATTSAPGLAPAPAAAATSDTSPAAGALLRAQSATGRRRRIIWIGAAAGSALGCALLAGLVMLGATVYGALSRDEGVAPSVTALEIVSEMTPATAVASVAKLATTTPIREAAIGPLQLTRAAFNAAADGTYTVEAITADARPTAPAPEIQPVGVRERPTLIPQLASVEGELVYFAKRATDDAEEPVFEIVVLDLTTRETRRFSAGEGSSTYPRPSPDGRWIAFQSNRDGDFEIYVTNRYGGQLQRLTENTVWDRLPAWSPDGDWIIYSSDTRRDQTLDLYRTRLSNGEKQLVYSDQWRNSHARYSPDGKHIVFTAGPSVRDAGTWEIRLIEPETGASKLLTDNAVRDASPAFSPDGQRIVYVTTVGGARALASMDLAGGDRRILYTGPGSVWSANYSPDGRFIAVTATVLGEDQLYLMDAQGLNAQRITSSGGAFASWIPPIAGQ